MWLWYDWRAAAIADANGNIVDEEIWDGNYPEHAIIERLQIIAKGGLIREAEVLAKRFPEATVLVHGDQKLPDADWPLPDDEAQAAADAAAISMSKLGVAMAAGDPDKRLEYLVRASDELRASHLTMEARLVEWVVLFLPEARFGSDRSALGKTVSESDDLQMLAKKLEVEMPPVGPSKSEWKALREFGEGVSTFRGRLDRLENAVRTLATEHLPSNSMLIGPLLAARLCVEAHGRMRFARLPSGTVQVLGAEKAFFNHLKTGAPPPKHGHIFMHPWVSRSPKWIRGKISRTLSAKISIAAKIDAFEGTAWTEEDVKLVENRIEEIRANFPTPQSRLQR